MFEPLSPNPEVLNCAMRTLRATVDEEGRVELLEPLQLSDKAQALLTILEPEVTQPRPSGLCKGEFRVPDDFDEPLPENILKDFERA